MIEYIIAENPDDRILKQSSQLVKAGKLICFPTDTNWIVACNPFDKSAVEKLYKFKDENKHKHFSILCSSFSHATDVAHISDFAFKRLKKSIPGHYTFIFEATKKITKSLQASKTDKEIGIRFCPNQLTKKILDHHDGLLLSTNIPKEKLDLKEEDTIYGYLIEDKLSHSIDLIIDPGELEFVGLSTVISFYNDEIEIIREGAGPISSFQ